MITILKSDKTMARSIKAMAAGLLVSAMAVAMVVASGTALAAGAPVAQNAFNTQQIQVPLGGSSLGQAFPYPSPIKISGFQAGSTITDVNVRVLDFGHSFPADADVLLVGPKGQKRTIMSDVSGGSDVSGVNLTLDDEATSRLPDSSGQLQSGTFKPTNRDGLDAFPAPAPVPNAKANLSVFDGTNPNGTWKLFVVDDTGNDVGAMNKGWGVQILAATP